MPQLPFPAATDSPAEHADWLELAALLSSTKSVSIQDFIGSLGLSGSLDALSDPGDFEDEDEQAPEADDASEPIAEAAFSELDERVRACGGESGSYPFELGENALSLRPGWKESIYVFLMVLAHFGGTAGESRTITKLFEEVAADALKVYLGSGSALMKVVVFGFPRNYREKGFAEALNKLCKDMGEGIGANPRFEVPAQKDAKLDIVGWKEFEDRQHGKIIVFGQCATGQWNEKLMELPDPSKWCTYWMQQVPTVLPLRSFFVPHRIPPNRWLYVCHFGGILFDRCRIALLLHDADRDLLNRCSTWTNKLLEESPVV